MAANIGSGHVVGGISAAGTGSGVAAIAGLNYAWMIVAAIVILFAELAVIKMFPVIGGHHVKD
jgi:hypothetical protein